MGTLVYLPVTNRKADDAPHSAHRPDSQCNARQQRNWQSCCKFNKRFEQILKMELISVRVCRTNLFLYFICPDRAVRERLYATSKVIGELVREIRFVFARKRKWLVSKGAFIMTPGVAADYPPKGVPHFMMRFQIARTEQCDELTGGVSYRLGHDCETLEDTTDAYLAEDDDD